MKKIIAQGSRKLSQDNLKTVTDKLAELQSLVTEDTGDSSYRVSGDMNEIEIYCRHRTVFYEERPGILDLILKKWPLYFLYDNEGYMQYFLTQKERAEYKREFHIY